jgi:hypothetical protein
MVLCRSVGGLALNPGRTHAASAPSPSSPRAHDPAPVFIPGAGPGAAPWQPQPPCSAVEEAAENLDADRALHAEEDDEEPVFVLTDEWA